MPESDITSGMSQTSGRRPRVMLAIHQGFSVRYLLQTDIFSSLKEYCDIIILCQDGAVEFSQRFADENVSIACVDAATSRGFQSSHRLERLLAFIRHYTHAGDVQTTEDHYQIAVKDGNLFKARFKTRTLHRMLRGFILLARRTKCIRRIVLWLESRLYLPQEHTEILRKHKPDLVITTSLGTFDYDQYVMRAANRLGIPTTTIVLSWDNTTARGYPGAMPDHAIAWTDAMTEELVNFNDMPREECWTGGIAHFDPYYREDPGFDPAAFKRTLGIEADKRIILVATKSPNAYAYNPNLAKILAEAIEDGRLPSDCQVLLRIHPLHYRFTNGKPAYGKLLDVYQELAAKHSSIVLNEPEIGSNAMDYDMAEAEILFLTRLLQSTNVLVNIFSTMNIEGAIFDVPLVNVSFEDECLLYSAPTDARFDIMIDWRATHNQRLLAADGCRTVWNGDEMINAVRDYLQSPEMDSEGRRRIVEQEAGPNKGNAGQAIADHILAQLGVQPS
jgi:hypothetical protein